MSAVKWLTVRYNCGLFTGPSILERARFQKCVYLWFQVHKHFVLDSSMLAFTVASHICISSPNKLLCLEKRLQLLLFHDRAPYHQPLIRSPECFFTVHARRVKTARWNGENRLLCVCRLRLPLEPKRVRPKSTDATGNSFSPQTEWKIKHQRWGERWGGAGRQNTHQPHWWGLFDKRRDNQ